MKKKIKTFLVWALLLLLFLVAYQVFTNPHRLEFSPFQRFERDAEAGAVAKVNVLGERTVQVTLRGGRQYLTLGDLDDAILQTLVPFPFDPPGSPPPVPRRA